MRKRIKRGLICRATPTYVIRLEEPEKPKKLFVRIFGDWKEIQPSDLPKYKGFKFEWR